MIRSVDVDKTGLVLIELGLGEDVVDYLSSLKESIDGFKLKAVNTDGSIVFTSPNINGKDETRSVRPEVTQLLIRNRVVVTSVNILVNNKVFLIKDSK